MEQRSSDLPEECWGSIVSRVRYDHRHLEQLSQVSKMFLSVTNHVRVTLKVTNLSTEILSKQLLRFPYLKKIDLSSFQGALHDALDKIFQSQLDLDELNVSHKRNPCVTLLAQIGSKMKSIRVLRCSYSYLSDNDLTILAYSFPSLQELDISHQYFQNITDEGIIALSEKLRRLQKINLTGNRKITDNSLISLSKNCVFLSEVILRNCGGITQVGLSFLMENSPNYNSLIIASYVNRPLVLTTQLKYSHHLYKIELCYIKVGNENLYEMVRSDLPLKNFRLSFCTGCTLDGISSFLKAYQSLESLALDGTEFLSDESVTEFSQYILNLVSINLDSCCKLTSSSFVTIASACRRINDIEISVSSSPSSSSEDKILVINPEIRTASFTCFNLEGFLHICPNLQVLKVTILAHSCELDIAYILDQCPELTHLTINHNGKIKLSEEGDQTMSCKLESLSLKRSWIDDRVLEMIGKRCLDLVDVDLEECMSVTEKGVRALVENCRKLRYVNLDWCTKVSQDDVVQMMGSRASLKEIVIPFALDHDCIDDSYGTNCLLTQGYSAAYQGHPWEDCCFNFAFGM